MLRAVGGLACPVLAVSEFMAVRSANPSFLVHADGSSLSRFQFSSILRTLLWAIGEIPREYGTHSFRIGAATEAALAGLPDTEVQRIGRWRLACFAGYVRPELMK